MTITLPKISTNEESPFEDYSHIRMYATESKTWGKTAEWHNAVCKIGDRRKEPFAIFVLL